MKRIVVLCFVIAIVFAFSSCKKSITACFDYVDVGGTVIFNPACSEGADNFFWDFGDGSFSKEYSPTHHYNSTGKYSVTLQVTDDYDLDAETKDIVITAILDSTQTGGSGGSTEVCKTCTCNLAGNVTSTDLCGTASEADNLCAACDLSPDCSCN